MSVQGLQNAHTVARGIVDGLGLDRADGLLVRVIGWLESNYGRGWKGPAAGSNNWGAITAGSSWTGPTFQHKDWRPDPADPSKRIDYVTSFRAYGNPEDGARDLWRVLSSDRHFAAVEAARAGDWDGVSEALSASKYYLAPVENHKAAVRRALASIAAGTGEEVAPSGAGFPGRVG